MVLDRPCPLHVLEGNAFVIAHDAALGDDSRIRGVVIGGIQANAGDADEVRGRRLKRQVGTRQVIGTERIRGVNELRHQRTGRAQLAGSRDDWLKLILPYKRSVRRKAKTPPSSRRGSSARENALRLAVGPLKNARRVIAGRHAALVSFLLGKRLTALASSCSVGHFVGDFHGRFQPTPQQAGDSLQLYDLRLLKL